MPVAIRLSRGGTKQAPFYRIVVVDSRKKRDGAVIEHVGSYDALRTRLVSFKPDRYDAWVKVGAQPSDTARKIYRLFKKQAGSSGAPETVTQAEMEVKPREESKVKKTISNKQEESESSAPSRK